MATGVVLIGILAWPLAAPADPLAPVRATNLTPFGATTLLLLAFVSGFIGYFLSWPYGREIGILAAPSGLAVWALRSGYLSTLIQTKPTLAQRQAIFASLLWEPLFWLLVVAAGFMGVIAAQKLRPSPPTAQAPHEPNSKLGKHIAAVIALALSALLAQIAIRIFAPDFSAPHSTAVAQPPTRQIAFAVLVSFGFAAFLVKKLLRVSYAWPILASAIATAISIRTYLKKDVIAHFLDSQPANFFPDVVSSVLPLQMVTFGVLGSVIGYWLAVRYDYWRRHESSQ